MPNWTDALRADVDLAAQRALADQDANPYSPTAGCFDRRYWAWKLVDLPESTFQRLVHPLAVLYRDPKSRLHAQPDVLQAVRSGLAYAARVQHPNGAFDQAFPFEQSFGATAFLLYPMLEAARLVDEHLTDGERSAAAKVAARAADFLCRHDERHGMIANHLAGASLALSAAADRLREPRFEARAAALLARVLDAQSTEGWFTEYDGADPGYQTLCVDYLSDLFERRPSPRLAGALDRAVAFLQWFAHPDGTFGGLYGSRRTSLVYLAGLARLAARNPVAAALCEAAATAMAQRDTAGPASVDAGNLAPMLTSAARSLDFLRDRMGDGAVLPCDRPAATADFPGAGIHVRGNARHYAICGVSNGGTLTVFLRDSRRLVLDDGGYVAALIDGALVTTQRTALDRQARVTGAAIDVEAAFVQMPAALPTPGRFLVLRLLNLTVMRNIAVGNWVKRRLVAMLMRGGGSVPLRLSRRVIFEEDGVRIEDRIDNPDGLSLQWMSGGRPFNGIHMASAGYCQPARFGTGAAPVIIDVDRLAQQRVFAQQRVV